MTHKTRTAVVLAAGEGSRLSGYSATPKPLIQLLGLSLIERVLLGFAETGVRQFRVVVGSRGNVVADAVTSSRHLRGLDVEIVDCPTHLEGNGHSLAAGAAGLDEPFFLSMSDHVFDSRIVRRLDERAAVLPSSVHLATDACVRDVYDLDDATKVSTESGRIARIGKQLTSYDCIDVGVFYCPRWLSALATKTIAAGGKSVSDVMSSAIERGAMRACPIEPLFWQDCDTPDMLAEAERRLFAYTQQSAVREAAASV